MEVLEDDGRGSFSGVGRNRSVLLSSRNDFRVENGLKVGTVRKVVPQCRRGISKRVEGQSCFTLY